MWCVLRSCETPLAHWVTFRKGYRDTTRKWLGHKRGQEPGLCWQQPPRSIHNSHSSTSWEPAAHFKRISPSTQEEICRWRDWPKAQRAIVGSERCAWRGKLPPGSVAAVRSRPHLDLCHWSKAPVRFSILNAPVGKSVPVGFSLKNRRSIIYVSQYMLKRGEAQPFGQSLWVPEFKWHVKQTQGIFERLQSDVCPSKLV